MNDEQLDKLFKDEFSKLEMTPDEGTWESIAADLDKQKIIVPLWRRNWVRYAAVVLLTAGVGTWAVRYYNQGQQPTPSERVASVPEKVIVQRPTEYQLPAATSAPLQRSDKTDKRLLTALPQHPNVSQQQQTVVAKRHEEPVTHRNTVYLHEVETAALTRTTADGFSNERLRTHRVVEIDPIQPLIENPEEEEMMLASRPSSGAGLVPGLLNKISEVVNPDDNKTIHFSKDEEGSLRIDIFNTLVKNRNRKRK